MKKQWKLLFAALAFIFINLSVQAQDKIVAVTAIPKEIKTYLKNHFPNNPVLQASVDQDLLSKSYDVILKNNIKLEFNSKNKIKEIDANSALPKSVIPAKIGKYVQINYPKNAITSWELDDRNQKVELDNGLALEFNLKDQFLRIDY